MTLDPAVPPPEEEDAAGAGFVDCGSVVSVDWGGFLGGTIAAGAGAWGVLST